MYTFESSFLLIFLFDPENVSAFNLLSLLYKKMFFCKHLKQKTFLLPCLKINSIFKYDYYLQYWRE